MEIKEKSSTIKKEFSWQTKEYRHYTRSDEWFWIVGLIIILGIILAIVAGNFLFAVIILIAGISVLMYATRPPDTMDILIKDSGIRIKDILFPFDNLTAFSLQDDEEPYELIIYPKDSWIYKNISLDLEKNIDPEELRKFLSNKLEEKPYEKSLLEALSYFLGF